MQNSTFPPPPAGNILVAEDNLLNQKIIKNLLQKEGYGVSVVANGLEALLNLEQTLFNALILDYQMPELDGFQTLQAIRAHAEEHIRQIPVIFLTGELNPETLRQIEKQGVAGILPKPLDPKKLIAAVANLVAPTPPENQPDTQYLYMITDGNRPLMVELINIFLEEAPWSIQKMKADLAAADFSALLKTIHKIRSNYKYVGLQEVETLLAKLENDVAQNHQPHTYANRIEEIEKTTLGFLETLIREKKLLENK